MKERERERKEVQDGLRTSAKQDKRYDWLREMRTLVGEKESDRKREREREIHDTEVYLHCKK